MAWFTVGIQFSFLLFFGLLDCFLPVEVAFILLVPATRCLIRSFNVRRSVWLRHVSKAQAHIYFTCVLVLEAFQRLIPFADERVASTEDTTTLWFVLFLLGLAYISLRNFEVAIEVLEKLQRPRIN